MNKKTRKTKRTRKTKDSLVTLFAFFLILGGIVALVYPIVGDILANRQRSTALVKYDDSLKKLSKGELSNKLNYAKKYNANIWSEQEGRGEVYPNIKYTDTINVEGVIATIDIPSISIKQMPVYHGTNELSLNQGLGHFEQSSLPIGGENTRSVISGHSGLQNQVLFSNVQNLKEGDIFYINILNKQLAYKIESIDEVLPTDVDKVKISEGKDMVTLLTCTPPGINTYRLLVNGIRIPYKKAKTEKVVTRDKFSYTKVVIFSLIAAALLALVLFFIYRNLSHRVKRASNSFQKKQAKKSLKRLILAVKILFVGLIIGIITILSFSIYGYSKIQQQKELGTIDVGINQQLSNYNLSKINRANYSISDISTVRVENYTESKLNFNQTVNNWGIGKIVVPDIEVNLPILAGMNNTNLLTGVATLDKSTQQGTGNYVLLAHNISDKAGNASPLLLGKINQLKPGSVIYTTDFKSLYTYELISNQIVDQSEVSYIEQPSDLGSIPIITLIRCEGEIGTKNRRIVQGKFVKQELISKLNQTSQKKMGLMNLSTKSNSNVTSDQQTYALLPSLCISLASIVLSNITQIVIIFSLILVVPIIFITSVK